MAVFTVSLDDKGLAQTARDDADAVGALDDAFNALKAGGFVEFPALAGAASASAGSLSAAFDALQKSIAQAAEAGRTSGLSEEFEALQKQLGEIEAAQKRAFAFHDKGAFKATSEASVLDDIKKQQAASLAMHDANRDAMIGRQKMAEQMAAKEQAANLAMHDANRDAMIGREKLMDDLAAKERENFYATQEGFQGVTDQLGPYADLLEVIANGWKKVANAYGQAFKMAIAFSQQEDALRTQLGALAGAGDEAGQEIMDMIDALTAGPLKAFTSEVLEPWAKSLLAAGIKGEALKRSLMGVAAAQALMGEGGASAAQTMLKMLAEGGKTAEGMLKQIQEGGPKAQRMFAEMGLHVEDVAAALGVTVDQLRTMKLTSDQVGDAIRTALIKKGEGPLKQFGLTLSSISAKLSESFESAFEDLGDIVRPFMTELQSLASEFFKGGTASNDFGKGIRAILVPAFDFATKAVKWLHLAFLEVQVATLEVRVAILPLTNALDKLGVSSGLVSYALVVLKYVVILVAVVFGLLAAAVLLAMTPFILMGIAIFAVVSAISYLVDTISGAIDNFDNLKNAAADAGANFITSLGNAISSGSAWVIGLVSALATGMIGAITGPLQIKSPSRVMRKIGRNVTEGMAQGVEQGTPDVQRAASGAADAAIDGAANPSSPGGGKGGLTVVVEKGAITINGASDVFSLTEEAFVVLLERFLLARGLKAT